MQFQYIDDLDPHAGGRADRPPAVRLLRAVQPVAASSRRSSPTARSGEDIDFENSRPGRGPTINLSATLRPTDHLELALLANQQWLNVDDAAGRVAPALHRRACRGSRAPTRSRRACSRAPSRNTCRPTAIRRSTTIRCRRTPGLRRLALLAYKLNWQSVMFVGYGDDRELTDDRRRPAASARAARPSGLREAVVRVPALASAAPLEHQDRDRSPSLPPASVGVSSKTAKCRCGVFGGALPVVPT